MPAKLQIYSKSKMQRKEKKKKKKKKKRKKKKKVMSKPQSSGKKKKKASNHANSIKVLGEKGCIQIITINIQPYSESNEPATTDLDFIASKWKK